MTPTRVVARSLTGRDWLEPVVDEALSRALAQHLALPDVVCRLLASRGVDVDSAPTFLAPRLKTSLPDPSVLKDMDQAATRLADAVERGETLGIISDYDTDGCTSAALVMRWARALGVETCLRVPHRLDEGYGPSPRLFDELGAANVDLVLVLDSGTTAFAALDHARQRGLDVVVVDHHQADAELPAAVAVVNPNRQDEDGRLSTLAAVGVTFLLLVAANRELRRRGGFAAGPEPSLMSWLDLVALGTVADVVPLLGLNRAFVSQGLKIMAGAGNPGIAALGEAAGLRYAPTAASLGFALAPRLNAAGRLDDASIAVDLLTTDDSARASELAQVLDGLNAERRRVEQALVDAATTQALIQVEDGRRALFAQGTDWHPGVLGIVAGRLAERFHRPALVASVAGDQAVGSARAPQGYDLGAALRTATRQGLTIKAGGHARAGGFTVARDKLETFADAIEATVGQPLTPSLRVDAAMAVGGACPALVEALACLEPFGESHPKPRLRLLGARLAGLRPVGDTHLKLRIDGHDGGRLEAIAFRARGTELEAALNRASSLGAVQVAGRVEADRYRGQGHCQLHLEDVAADD